MVIIAVIIFLAGYMAIAFEHSLHVNKAASALLTGVGCWLCYFLTAQNTDDAVVHLLHDMGEIASILFFLLGAMTIVELIATYDGFDIITAKITTTSKRTLLLIVIILTFFLSAMLDNLTTAIVMITLLQKLVQDKNDRLLFAGMVVIAANAGGAWSVLGDVTTTMLWIGGQVTPVNIIVKTFIPSVMVCAVPLVIMMRRFGNAPLAADTQPATPENRSGRIILFLGIGLLLFVPVFKTVTHMPPFMGMLLALGIIWVFTSIMQIRSGLDDERYSVTSALEKIDTPSILFFLGILLAVSALGHFGILISAANAMQEAIGSDYGIAVALGLLSAVVDNVPLVAAAQGMYSLEQYPTDHSFWELLALTTGTGGSAIIIGSAAGVAAMGIEKIQFMWYLKKISWLALLGFAAGIVAYAAQEYMFGI